MILLSTVSVIRHLICGNNYNRLLNLYLIYENTVDWGRKQLNDFNAEKTQLVLFDRSNKTGAIDVKMVGLLLSSDVSRDFLGRPISAGGLEGGGTVIPLMGPGQSPGGCQVAKLLEASRI